MYQHTTKQVLSIATGVAACVLCLLTAVPGLHAGDDSANRNALRITMYGAALGSTDNGTLDPLRTYQMLYFNLQHQIFETLVAIDFNTNTVLPVLAEKWERIGPQTVRFHLRHGVRFHNGERFNAGAVKFTLELMQNPRNRFAGRFLLDSIESIKISDDYTVDIKTRTPDAMLLRKLAAIGFIFPPGYFSRVGDSYFSRYPMGTGPFRVFYVNKTSDGIKELHFVKNEDYWNKIEADFKELVYRFIPQDQQWEALKNGQVDIVISQYADGRQKDLDKNKFNVFSQLTLRNGALLMNIDRKGPLENISVRKALQHAINRRELIDKALNGYGNPLYSVAPKGSVGHCMGPILYREDEKKSRGLLAEAGFKNGLTLKLLASASEPSAGVAALLKKQLARIGITLEITCMSRSEIFNEIVGPKLKGQLQPSSFDLWLISGWPNMFGTGAHFYFVFLHSQGMFNFGTHMGQVSPIDDLYTQAITSDQKQLFCDNLKKIDNYLLEQSLVVPLYQMELIYGMRKNISFSPGMNDLPYRFSQCRCGAKH